MAVIFVNNDPSLEEIQKFKEIGEFDNNIDEFGNVNIKYKINDKTNANEVYVKLNLNTITYDETRIKDTSNIEFSELVSAQTNQEQDLEEILLQYNVTLAENKNLNEIVNGLINKYENNNDKSVIDAMKTEIINLRIELRQGNYPSDFQDTFPFLPIA